MKKLFFFVFSRTLWINVLLAAIVVFALVLGTMHYLKTYTMHGDLFEVPDFSNTPVAGLDEFTADHNLRYVIVDSLYSDAHEPGTVVNQNPDPGAKVKKNRKIFLTVNATQPPMVTMRDMVGLSKRQAVSMLSAMGLETDSLVYRPDICVDCVLDQRYRGKSVAPGTKLKKGVKITLVLGGGREGRVLLPDFRGLTYREALDLMYDNTLLMGAVLSCEGCDNEEDTLRAFVYHQRPVYYSGSKAVVPMGSPIDLYLSTDSTYTQATADSAAVDTLWQP